MCQYWVNREDVPTKLLQPGFRATDKLDCARTAAGMVERPDLFDDGDLNLEPTASVGAFLGVSKSEGRCWA